MKTGRPVRIALSREEDMSAMRSRHPVRTRIRTGARRDGTFVARAIETWFDGGAYADDTAAVMNFALFSGPDPTASITSIWVGHAVYTNKLRAGAFRGFGNPQVTFASECQIDDLAAKLGIDPVDLRLKNLVHAGDRWMGARMSRPAARGCIEKSRPLRAGGIGPYPAISGVHTDSSNADRPDRSRVWQRDHRSGIRSRRSLGIAEAAEGAGAQLVGVNRMADQIDVIEAVGSGPKKRKIHHRRRCRRHRRPPSNQVSMARATKVPSRLAPVLMRVRTGWRERIALMSSSRLSAIRTGRPVFIASATAIGCTIAFRLAANPPPIRGLTARIFAIGYRDSHGHWPGCGRRSGVDDHTVTLPRPSTEASAAAGSR